MSATQEDFETQLLGFVSAATLQRQRLEALKALAACLDDGHSPQFVESLALCMRDSFRNGQIQLAEVREQNKMLLEQLAKGQAQPQQTINVQNLQTGGSRYSTTSDAIEGAHIGPAIGGTVATTGGCASQTTAPVVTKTASSAFQLVVGALAVCAGVIALGATWFHLGPIWFIVLVLAVGVVALLYFFLRTLPWRLRMVLSLLLAEIGWRTVFEIGSSLVVQGEEVVRFDFTMGTPGSGIVDIGLLALIAVVLLRRESAQ